MQAGGIRPPSTGVTGSHQCKCWELNLGPPQSSPALHPSSASYCKQRTKANDQYGFRLVKCVHHAMELYFSVNGNKLIIHVIT